jgi:hypothetical protein
VDPRNYVLGIPSPCEWCSLKRPLSRGRTGEWYMLDGGAGQMWSPQLASLVMSYLAVSKLINSFCASVYLSIKS